MFSNIKCCYFLNKLKNITTNFDKKIKKIKKNFKNHFSKKFLKKSESFVKFVVIFYYSYDNLLIHLHPDYLMN